jgi:hypothetical protein
MDVENECLLRLFVDEEDLSAISESIEKAINDFYKYNIQINSYIRNPVFLKNRKNNSAIVFVNDYIYETHFNSVSSKVIGCGRFTETQLSNDSVIIVFKSNNVSMLSNRFLLQNKGKNIFYYSIDFKKKTAKVLKGVSER